MATLTIKNLPDAPDALIKVRAQVNGNESPMLSRVVIDLSEP